MANSVLSALDEVETRLGASASWASLSERVSWFAEAGKTLREYVRVLPSLTELSFVRRTRYARVACDVACEQLRLLTRVSWRRQVIYEHPVDVKETMTSTAKSELPRWRPDCVSLALQLLNEWSHQALVQVALIFKSPTVIHDRDSAGINADLELRVIALLSSLGINGSVRDFADTLGQVATAVMHLVENIFTLRRRLADEESLPDVAVQALPPSIVRAALVVLASTAVLQPVDKRAHLASVLRAALKECVVFPCLLHAERMDELDGDEFGVHRFLQHMLLAISVLPEQHVLACVRDIGGLWARAEEERDEEHARLYGADDGEEGGAEPDPSVLSFPPTLPPTLAQLLALHALSVAASLRFPAITEPLTQVLVGSARRAADRAQTSRSERAVLAACAPLYALLGLQSLGHAALHVQALLDVLPFCATSFACLGGGHVSSAHVALGLAAAFCGQALGSSDRVLDLLVSTLRASVQPPRLFDQIEAAEALLLAADKPLAPATLAKLKQLGRDQGQALDDWLNGAPFRHLPMLARCIADSLASVSLCARSNVVRALWRAVQDANHAHAEYRRRRRVVRRAPGRGSAVRWPMTRVTRAFAGLFFAATGILARGAAHGVLEDPYEAAMIVDTLSWIEFARAQFMPYEELLRALTRSMSQFPEPAAPLIAKLLRLRGEVALALAEDDDVTVARLTAQVTKLEEAHRADLAKAQSTPPYTSSRRRARFLDKLLAQPLHDQARRTVHTLCTEFWRDERAVAGDMHREYFALAMLGSCMHHVSASYIQDVVLPLAARYAFARVETLAARAQSTVLTAFFHLLCEPRLYPFREFRLVLDEPDEARLEAVRDELGKHVRLCLASFEEGHARVEVVSSALSLAVSVLPAPAEVLAEAVACARAILEAEKVSPSEQWQADFVEADWSQRRSVKRCSELVGVVASVAQSLQIDDLPAVLSDLRKLLQHAPHDQVRGILASKLSEVMTSGHYSIVHRDLAVRWLLDVTSALPCAFPPVKKRGKELVRASTLQ